jgi:hypothetical protein
MIRTAILGILLAGSAYAPAAADGRWLDRKPIAAWNKAGAPLPWAPKTEMTDEDRVRCGEAFTTAATATPEQKLLAQRGWWTLSAKWTGEAERRGPSHPVVWGLIGVDGMCRPLAYQGFVFVDGKFVGTVSPRLMSSRTDGAAITHMAVAQGGLEMEFVRYTPQDAYCCPSRLSKVRYEIRETRTGKVLVATGAVTRAAPK